MPYTNMLCCDSPAIRDLTQTKLRPEDIHLMCLKCGSHDYRDTFYNRKEWERYIEEFNYSDGSV
jgi:hypothetical protein